MRVLKDGNLGKPEAWKQVVTCEKKDKIDEKGCGAEVEVKPADLLVMYWHGTHFPHYYLGMQCPQCGKYNRVSNVPEPVATKIMTPRSKRSAIFDGFSEEI